MERAEYPNDVDMNVIRGGALTNRDPAFVDVVSSTNKKLNLKTVNIATHVSRE